MHNLYLCALKYVQVAILVSNCGELRKGREVSSSIAHWLIRVSHETWILLILRGGRLG